jgi:hypothetical protein
MFFKPEDIEKMTADVQSLTGRYRERTDEPASVTCKRRGRFIQKSLVLETVGRALDRSFDRPLYELAELLL